MVTRLSILFIAVLLASTSHATAATRRVPSEYPAVQDGINAAAIGDTVLIAPGSYLENVRINRRLVLLSESGPEVTTIDGQYNGPTVLIEYYVDHATIEGLRVIHGDDLGFHSAAGITFELLTAQGGYGTARRNIVEYNRAYYGAGGIFAVKHAVIEDNLIQYNNQDVGNSYAGAMWVSGIIERNVVRYNGEAQLPAIVWLNGTDTFAWNTVVANGNGIYTVLIENGGVIHHNTIAGNDVCLYSTVYLSGDNPIEFRNNIVVHGNWEGLECSAGPRVIRCNDVWGSGPSYNGACAEMAGVDGNFSADPLFCNALQGDYRLDGGSPCAPLNSPGGCELIGALPIGCGVMSIKEEGVATPGLRLMVLPNPAFGVVQFKAGGDAERGVIEVYNSRGAVVQVLGGADPIRWVPGAEVRSGIYFARLLTGGQPAVAKFVFMR